jgi:hypothetical protein
MHTRAVVTDGLPALALFLAPIAGAGCVASADPVGAPDDGPPASVSEAAADPPVVPVDPDPAGVQVLRTCRGVANIFVDTGQIGFQRFPRLELGTCASDAFTIFDPFEPGLDHRDLFNISEAAEICGNIGASRRFVRFFTGPGVTPIRNFCVDFPGRFFRDRLPRRRWVSEFGCCAAGTVG